MSTLLDAFGGSGVVSYAFKKQGKRVLYNDILTFNSIIGKALIENPGFTLTDSDIQILLTSHPKKDLTVIQEEYRDIFFTDEENVWLDGMVNKIRDMEPSYAKDIAWFALFQSCIIKRPFSLFHRANLRARLSNVPRSFGNKTTWDAPFPYYFRKFAQEANAAVFDNGIPHASLNQDALTISPDDYGIDAVYIDTPYLTARGTGTDYIDFYGFLEGMVHYDTWKSCILPQYKHKPIQGRGNPAWTSEQAIYQSFDRLFSHFRNQKLIVSYRNDGIPSISELIQLLRKYKDHVNPPCSIDYQYRLSRKRSREVLLIAY